MDGMSAARETTPLQVTYYPPPTLTAAIRTHDTVLAVAHQWPPPAHERDDGGHGGGLDLMHVAGQLRGGHCPDIQHTQQEQEDLRQVKNELAYMARVGQEITHK